MICSKCGADCDPLQFFCLRCGAPLNPENNIDNNNEEIRIDLNDNFVDSSSQINLFEEDIDRENNSSQERHRNSSNRRNPAGNSSRNNGAERRGQVSGNGRNNGRSADRPARNRSQEVNNRAGKSRADIAGERKNNYDNSNNDNEVSFFEKNKKVIIGVAIAIFAIALIIILLIVFAGKNSYEDYYNEGMSLYTNGKYESSITQFEKASEVADTDAQKLEVYKQLWETYALLDDTEYKQIEVLKKLIELEPANEGYYKALITLYDSLGQEDNIDSLIDSVDDETLKEELKNFDSGVPVPTVKEGEYNTPISIGLTGPTDSTIYYTINGGDPTTSSTVYSKQIDLDTEGEYIIKAIAVPEDGEAGEQFVGTYTLKFTTVSTPTVNLDSGVYHERENLIVKADEGCRIFYTTNETTPTKDSKEYTKPFKIPEKNIVYYFRAMDENGVYSDVITRAYDFEREYTYSYDSAASSIMSMLCDQGVTENTYGYYEDGSAMYLAYIKIAKIDKEFYYIVSATKEDSAGSIESTDYYAFNANTGSISKAVPNGETYTLDNNISSDDEDDE